MSEMPDEPPIRSMMQITADVAQRYGLTVADLRGGRCKQLIAEPRHEAMALCYRGRSNMKVALFFGLSDHTSVIHARARYAERQAMATPA